MSVIGNKGKFSERIKRIALNRRKKSLNIDNNDNDLMYKNFLKVMAAIPLVVYDNLVITSDDNLNNDNKNKTDDKETYNNDFTSSLSDEKRNIKSVNRQRLINDLDVSLIKKKQNEYFRNVDINDVDGIKETKIIDNDVKKLEKRIIDRIKKNLIKTVNELEIIQSELYLINEVKGDCKSLGECEKVLDEVKKMICKIDIIKRKYDFLRDNYDFEYLTEVDDTNLVDDIIELKNKFSSNEIKATVVDYKLLEVYKYLYLRIDKLEEEVLNFDLKKEEELSILKERDIDFEKLKSDVYNVERVNVDYDGFVRRQNELLDDLNKKISKISSYEDVNYKIRGLNQLIFNSFKYLGLLMVSPLKGVIPSIATQSILTKNVVSNLFNNLGIDESKKMVYSAIDYSYYINNAISDLDYTDRMVSSTLEDIVGLKIKYNEEFRRYQGDFLEYENVINKINDMENKIIGNKIKIEIMKKRMLENERKNHKKLELVRELNQKESERLKENG